MRKLNNLKLKQIACVVMISTALGISAAAQCNSGYIGAASRTECIVSSAATADSNGGGTLGSEHVVSSDRTGLLGGGGRIESTESGGYHFRSFKLA